jgi:hypothetical protein
VNSDGRAAALVLDDELGHHLLVVVRFQGFRQLAGVGNPGETKRSR